LAGADSAALNLVGSLLRAGDFTVQHIRSHLEAAIVTQRRAQDLVVFVEDGTNSHCHEACLSIREVTQVPILIVCEELDGPHVADAFSRGADEHVSADVDVEELRARVAALMRRNQASSYATSDILTFGSITLDARRGLCYLGNTEVPLTRNEFRLLWSLALVADAVVERTRLIEQVWGSPYHASPENLRKLVQRLRSSLTKAAPGAGELVRVVPGLGYGLSSCRSPNGRT
jgi:DNA-binding response OmpR family regulator